MFDTPLMGGCEASGWHGAPLVDPGSRLLRTIPFVAGERSLKGCAAVIGSFDGLHLGHRALVRLAREVAGSAAVVAVTTDPHPRRFFVPYLPRFELSTFRQKIDLFQQVGVDAVSWLRFDDRTAQLSPDEFIDQVLCSELDAATIIVGGDFRFGRSARGDVCLLGRALASRGRRLIVAPTFQIDGDRCSSSRIRHLLAVGDAAGASRLLGRDWSFSALIHSPPGPLRAHRRACAPLIMPGHYKATIGKCRTNMLLESQSSRIIPAPARLVEITVHCRTSEDMDKMS